MSVKIKLDYVLRHSAGKKDTITVNGSTVAECLDDLIRQFPALKNHIFNKQGRAWAWIKVNDETISLKNLDRAVTDGDEIKLFGLIGGG